MKNNTVSKGGKFEKEVEQLLRLKGYKTTRNELINGTQIDLVAKKNNLFENICFVVECTDRKVTVGVDLVKQKSAVLLSLTNSQYIFRLIFVARNGFTAEAKAYANSYSNVLLLTLNDLENQIIDFEPYKEWYLYNFEKSSGIFKEGELHKNYVELTAKDENENIIPSLKIETKKWLNNKSNNLLFILGEYGAGKTSFSRNLVYQLLVDKYRQNESQHYIPILINLREYRGGSPNLQQVITDTLINLYGVQMSSFMAFEHLCSNGKILLILDGFDEMAGKSDKQTLIDSFNQIYLLASLNTKIILTCRSNFFQSHSDIIELLSSFSIDLPISDKTESKIVQLSFENQGRILHIEKLNPEQIQEFIKKRFGESAEKIFMKISSIHDLSDLSTRPVLLDMILKTLPELSKTKKKINSAALYEYYTNKWTARDNWRVKIPLVVRQGFCETLAWILHNSDIQEVKYETLEKAMLYSLNQIEEDLEKIEKFKNDIQTCSFLVRVGFQNEFRFAHKSFLEFFVGRKIIIELSKGLVIEKPKEEDWSITKNIDSLSFEHQAREHYFIKLRRLLEHYDGTFYDNPNSTFAPLSNTFTPLYKSVDRELRATNTFISLFESNLSKKWTNIHFDSELKSEVETQLKEILTSKSIPNKANNLRITEEIATFAIEYLDISDIKLRGFVEKLISDDSTMIFSDILRLNKSQEFIQQNIKFIKNYIENGKKENLKTAFCASLAKVPNIIDMDFILDMKSILHENGWSYFLFELAVNNNYKKLFKEIFEKFKLKTIDKIICIHGMKETLSEKGENALVSKQLVLELLQSLDDEERDLGLTFCQSVILPENVSFELMKQIIKESSNERIKTRAISVLGTLEGKKYLLAVRNMWANEKNKKIRRLLKNAEKNILDNMSKSKNKVSWHKAKNDKGVRDSLWQSFRK